MKPKYYFLLFLTLLVSFSPVQAAFASGFSASEIRLKIALIYNFSKFVTWPDQRFDNETSPVLLCIYGENEYSSAAKRVHGKLTQNGRKLNVTTINSPEELSACHILFISHSTLENLGQIPQISLESPVLTIGDSEKFIPHGGIINLIEINSKIRFEISLKAAEARSLTISSKLLRLAKEVY